MTGVLCYCILVLCWSQKMEMEVGCRRLRLASILAINDPTRQTRESHVHNNRVSVGMMLTGHEGAAVWVPMEASSQENRTRRMLRGLAQLNGVTMNCLMLVVDLETSRHLSASRPAPLKPFIKDASQVSPGSALDKSENTTPPWDIWPWGTPQHMHAAIHSKDFNYGIYTALHLGSDIGVTC